MRERTRPHCRQFSRQQSHTERFQLQLPGVHRLRIHRPALVKTKFQMDPFQRALFLFCGRRRDRLKALYWEGAGFLLLYKRLEAAVSNGPGVRRKYGPCPPAVPLADGGTEDRAAEGKQSGVRSERDLMPESAESTGFLRCFVVSFLHGKQEGHCRKHPGNGKHLTGGI